MNDRSHHFLGGREISGKYVSNIMNKISDAINNLMQSKGKMHLVSVSKNLNSQVFPEYDTVYYSSTTSTAMYETH